MCNQKFSRKHFWQSDRKIVRQKRRFGIVEANASSYLCQRKYQRNFIGLFIGEYVRFEWAKLRVNWMCANHYGNNK